MSIATIVAEPLVAFRSELGEGPLWDHRAGRLVWVDIMGGLVHLTLPSSGVVTSIDVGRHVGAAALWGQSAFLLAVRDGFAALAGGIVGDLVQVVDDPQVRMNDGAVDPAGRFLAGTMRYDAARGAGTLYSREVDGSVRTLVEAVTISNGLAWSEDGSRVYYVDSPTRGVDVFDYDVERGTLANRRRHVTVEREAGFPDGLTMDADGCLWLALYGGGRVRRYAPDGAVMAEVEVPTRQVTSCAFGGARLDTLFITTAAQGLDLADPANATAGHLFVADPGCAGRAESVVPAPG